MPHKCAVSSHHHPAAAPSTAVIKPMTLRLYCSPPNWSAHDLTMLNPPPSQRPTVPLLMTTSYDPALLSADTGPCGTPAAADGEVKQIICPTQITGGLQLTLTGFKCQKLMNSCKMIYIREFTSRLHKSRRYYKTYPKNWINLVFLYMCEKVFPIISSRVQKNNTHLASRKSSSNYPAGSGRPATSKANKLTAG